MLVKLHNFKILNTVILSWIYFWPNTCSIQNLRFLMNNGVTLWPGIVFLVKFAPCLDSCALSMSNVTARLSALLVLFASWSGSRARVCQWKSKCRENTPRSTKRQKKHLRSVAYIREGGGGGRG